MNILDIIILTPMLWGIYKGITRGLVAEVASLAALILGIWCARHFSKITNNILINTLNFDIAKEYQTVVSFATTFLLVVIIIILISKLIDSLLSAIALGGVNRALGAVFGAAKTLLIMSILVYFTNNLDQRMNFIPDEKKIDSLTYNPLVNFIENILPQIDFDEIKEKVPEVGI